MKNFLIIPSFLLLSSPLFGIHNGEILYRWETSSGFQWMIFGEKETHPQYKGQVENGKPTGLGVLTYPNGMKYVGEWKKGIRHGKGSQIHPDGWKYKGEWKGGLFHGQGTYTWSNGEKYVGEWKDGERWNGTSFDQNENTKTEYVNGKRTYK